MFGFCKFGISHGSWYGWKKQHRKHLKEVVVIFCSRPLCRTQIGVNLSLEGRTSIPPVYGPGQQQCNSTTHNGVSIYFGDFEACGLFSFFAILLSIRMCPTTLQVRLGQKQIIRLLAGDPGWPKPCAVWMLETFWRSQRCAISWQPTAGTSNCRHYFWGVLLLLN